MHCGNYRIALVLALLLPGWTGLSHGQQGYWNRTNTLVRIPPPSTSPNRRAELGVNRYSESAREQPLPTVAEPVRRNYYPGMRNGTYFNANVSRGSHCVPGRAAMIGR